MGALNVYLIDKPGAAQSVIVAGHYGMKRDSPDFYKTDVMNTILGGKFTSRLNMNLRENKGYTYGARSIFMYRPDSGSVFGLRPGSLSVYERKSDRV